MAFEIFVGEHERLVMTAPQVLEHAQRIGAGTVSMSETIRVLRREVASYHSFVEELGGVPGVSDLHSMALKINSDSSVNYELLQERMKLRAVCCIVSQYLGRLEDSLPAGEIAGHLEIVAALDSAIKYGGERRVQYKIAPVDATSEMCEVGAKVLSSTPGDHYEMVGRFNLAYAAALKIL